MIYTDEKLPKNAPRYLPEGFQIASKESVTTFFDDIMSAEINSAQDLETLLYKYSELLKALSDELAWRYIRMTVNADKEEYAEAYNDFYANVYSSAEPYSFQLKQRYYDSPYRTALDPETYAHLDRIIANDLELYREENIPLKVKESELANRYGAIVGQLSAQFEGEERTVSQLSVYLKDPSRLKREAAWRKIYELYQTKAEELDRLFDELRELRMQIASNAGYDNFRDYMHKELGRFSYSPEEIYKFHDAVENVVMPFVKELDAQRQEVLQLESLRPWDSTVDLDGRTLKPFENTDEFVSKCTRVLGKLKDSYGLQLEMMSNTGLLDLENRKGKAPGGYNTGINEYGSSFIFMNHVKQHNDVVTLLHEAGHAMHSQATTAFALAQYQDTPSEVAELASMSMELLSMDYWDLIYDNPEDLKKAKRDQLQGTITFLPWAMTVDAFQHWIYLHPEHNEEQRAEAYIEISKRFSSITDWDGLEEYRKIGWMKQLHIFEVPFYYIEYGMAQLGALSIYMNYRKDPEAALKAYQNFLNLGYSTSVPEIYRAAGIEFDFSEGRIRELIDFVRSELVKIESV